MWAGHSVDTGPRVVGAPQTPQDPLVYLVPPHNCNRPLAAGMARPAPGLLPASPLARRNAPVHLPGSLPPVGTSKVNNIGQGKKVK